MKIVVEDEHKNLSFNSSSHDGKKKSITLSHGIWNVTYRPKEKDNFFVEMKSLIYSIQSWQCADKNLCNGLIWNDTHSYEKGDDLYSGILLKIKMHTDCTSLPLEDTYRIWCKKPSGKSKERTNWQSYILCKGVPKFCFSYAVGMCYSLFRNGLINTLACAV